LTQRIEVGFSLSRLLRMCRGLPKGEKGEHWISECTGKRGGERRKKGATNKLSKGKASVKSRKEGREKNKTAVQRKRTNPCQDRPQWGS